MEKRSNNWEKLGYLKGLRGKKRKNVSQYYDLMYDFIKENKKDSHNFSTLGYVIVRLIVTNKKWDGNFDPVEIKHVFNKVKWPDKKNIKLLEDMNVNFESEICNAVADFIIESHIGI